MPAPKYSIILNTEESYFTDPSPTCFIAGEKDGKKYFINRDRILFFRELDEKTEGQISKQH
ncbi:MAG: hypothetical protein IIB07_03450 [Bacteroidetes bacterium]|nr:hypothetical protein [Bacteroidota bacterium]MCH8943067.1 hypothetical protein [Bacteroidota bacterium]